jgi:hypothetical protein
MLDAFAVRWHDGPNQTAPGLPMMNGLEQIDPFPPDALAWPIARRIDAMLARLNGYDFLGAVAFAESVLLEMPAHELALLCHREALAVVSSFLDSPLRVVRTDTAGLTEAAFAMLSGADGSPPSALLPAGAADRVKALVALHELVRLAYFDTRENTFVEAIVGTANEMPRIDERANDAAMAELDRVLALYPSERFGIGRCEEGDFGTLWQHEAFTNATDIFPVAVGSAADSAKREKHLKLTAHGAYPARFVLLHDAPPAVAEGTHVVYVVIAPKKEP